MSDFYSALRSLFLNPRSMEDTGASWWRPFPILLLWFADASIMLRVLVLNMLRFVDIREVNDGAVSVIEIKF